MKMSTVIDFVSLSVPWPVSVNDMYTYIPQLKRPGKSSAYLKYERAIYQHWIEARSLGKIVLADQPLCFWAFAFPPRKGCDMDNIQKVLFDCLEKAGAFENDSQIESIRIEKSFRVSWGAVYFHLCSKTRFEEMADLYRHQMPSATQPFAKIQSRHPFSYNAVAR